MLVIYSARVRSRFIDKNAFNELIVKYNDLTIKHALEEEKVKNLDVKLEEREKVYKNDLEEQKKQLTTSESKADDFISKFIEAEKEKATISATLDATLINMAEKVDTQKKELESVRKQFNMEFENIASKILEEKSEKFSKLNQDSLTAILKPLGENIDNFKKKVEDVYDKESKERFSLGKEVEKLVLLNQKISEEANNLTNALKGNSKTQGDWGQMILENILEKSGLVKDREYFVQQYLKDDAGNYHINDEGSKMQPDIIIAYPDNRKVIIDSKVSLIAYTRYVGTDNVTEQQVAIEEHLKSIRKHVDDLSKKSYQDFAPSLDFVMMFIPNEPAYYLALQKDSDLWHYAYNKRVILISPTNMVLALKLIVDLWKREYHNRNAQEIAEKGGALYDKLVGFVEDIQGIGSNLDKTQASFNAALNKLKDGRGNLIGQAEKLKELGIKNKKHLSLVSTSDSPPEA